MAAKTAAFLLASMAVSVMALPTRNSSASDKAATYCYGKDPKPFMRFGSMEAYEPKHGDLSKIQSPKGKKDLYQNKIIIIIFYTFRL